MRWVENKYGVKLVPLGTMGAFNHHAFLTER